LPGFGAELRDLRFVVRTVQGVAVPTMVDLAPEINVDFRRVAHIFGAWGAWWGSCQALSGLIQTRRAYYGGVDGTFSNIIFQISNFPATHRLCITLRITLALMSWSMYHTPTFIHIRLYLHLHALTHTYHPGLRLYAHHLGIGLTFRCASGI